MNEVLVQGAVLFGMVLVAALFVIEARRWRTLESVIGRKQRILRIWLFAIIETLLAMMVVGPWVIGSRSPVAALVYWSLCVLLLPAVVMLALLDLRAVLKGYVRAHRDLFRDLSEGEGDKSERR